MTSDPTVKRQPDFDNLRRTLLRQGPPGPVPFLELFADPGTMEVVLGEKFPVDLRKLVLGSSQFENTTDFVLKAKQVMDMILRFCYETGYDYVYIYPGLGFPRSNLMATGDTADNANTSDGQRYWQDENTGPIQNWADFERYPWPKAEDVSFAAVEYFNAVMPDGMKISVNLPGVLENASWLMGFQSFSYALFDEPDLIKAIVERVGEVTVATARHAASIDNVGMLFLGDDMGYSGGTLVSPAVLREYIFPYHKRLTEAAHAAGKLMVLHSCGNLEKIMDEVIDNGFDAKQSFEDKIIPMEDAYSRWGDRIAVAGGLDMDLLARGTEEQVRRRTREVLAACAAKGTGYCLGTGNTVANYIPRQNYLAMLDEGHRWNHERFGTPL
jgi:uroporphyrinogen decarboxylase